jgi:hypothetical protein
MAFDKLRHAELVGHDARAHLLHRALGQGAETEGPVGEPDQPVHLEAQSSIRREIFGVLSLAQADRETPLSPPVAGLA